MKTLAEIAHSCQLATDQVRRARRIESELGTSGENALRIARATMASALQDLEERIQDRELARV